MSRFEAVDPQKKKLRQRFRARRQKLGHDEASRASKAVCRRLRDATLFHSVQSVAGYAPLGREIDVGAFLRQCIKQGVEVSLPRVMGSQEMVFCPIEDWDELEPGAFGIDEPCGPATSSENIEVFLVPGLAFDSRGHRLGFGKGYYDRALPAPGNALAVGVGYHWQFVDDELPAAPHDRPMDVVVTDRIWHRVGDDNAQSGGR